MKYILLILFSFSVNAAPNYFMPKESLKTDLRIRLASTVKSVIVCRVKPYTALKHILKRDNWYLVETSDPDCKGYVSSGSVVPFDDDLWFIADKVFNGMWVHKVGSVLYVSAAELCFIMDTTEFENIPIGKDEAITVKQYINNRGGLDGLTQEQRKNCNFR